MDKFNVPPPGPGHYMYIESSAPRLQGEIAILQTSWLVLNEDKCNVSFWYHMFGDHVGSLEVRTFLVATALLVINETIY